MMIPQVLGIIQRTYTGPARTWALGAYTAVMAVGAPAGQIAGGALVSADLFGAGRRPVFLVNVPIGALLWAAGPWLTPRVRPSGAARGLDLPGLVLLAGPLVLVTVNALHYSALRTGLTFVPTALAYGVVGLWWRRLPRRLHPLLVPGGFVVVSAALVRTGLAFRAAGPETAPGRSPRTAPSARASVSPTVPILPPRWSP
ncbi:hypothetical protein [Streptomyces decoyicus]|uniref:hypothetical protein n=1 Tax=Streptomyces decoyicus TaxID=249567 RepID=UPI0006627B36|nr:hypothetical protein [Streptomyces decoyicus]QZY15980.1 hypothetical protein K7C20_12510 [Streptomyces decoyicus]